MDSADSSNAHGFSHIQRKPCWHSRSDMHNIGTLGLKNRFQLAAQPWPAQWVLHMHWQRNVFTPKSFDMPDQRPTIGYYHSMATRGLNGMHHLDRASLNATACQGWQNLHDHWPSARWAFEFNGRFCHDREYAGNKLLVHIIAQGNEHDRNFYT